MFRRRRARFYNRGRNWFFNTREEAPIGPFKKLSEAVAWAKDYTAYIQTAPVLEDVVELPPVGNNTAGYASAR